MTRIEDQVEEDLRQASISSSQGMWELDRIAANALLTAGLESLPYFEIFPEGEFPEEYQRLWERRGFKVGKVGYIGVYFDGRGPYTYPLYIERKK